MEDKATIICRKVLQILIVALPYPTISVYINEGDGYEISVNQAHILTIHCNGTFDFTYSHGRTTADCFMEDLFPASKNCAPRLKTTWKQLLLPTLNKWKQLLLPTPK